jgi:hypothetical protein
MINIGNKGVISKNIQTPNGMLYEKTKVKVIDKTSKKVQVSDMAGRLFWVKHSDILM